MSTTGRLERIDRGSDYWEDVLASDQGHFPRPWKSEDWSSLSLSHHRLWVWVKDGRAIGFALFSTPLDETAHLLKILILPEYRGKGESLTFWGMLTKELQAMGYARVFLEVEESNARAQGFYQGVGFTVLHRAKSYYSDGENAVMMQLTL